MMKCLFTKLVQFQVFMMSMGCSCCDWLGMILECLVIFWYRMFLLVGAVGVRYYKGFWPSLSTC